MLKIKDNVDLKELEKYGFEYKEEDYWGDTKWHYYCLGNICIDELNEGYEQNHRVLDTYDFGYSDRDAEVLYDLIKADIVEKVESEE